MAGKSRERIEQLRDLAEHEDEAIRCKATLELIAAGQYLAYSDARYAAGCALKGAHIDGDKALRAQLAATLDALTARYGATQALRALIEFEADQAEQRIGRIAAVTA